MYSDLAVFIRSHLKFFLVPSSLCAGFLLAGALTLASRPAPSLLDREMAASVMVEDADGNGHGSGVAIGADLVLTAAHVTAEGAPFTIRTADGAAFPSEVLWESPTRDVALVKVLPRREFDKTVGGVVAVNPALTHAELACRAPILDEPIVVIGSPLQARFVATHGTVASAHPIEGEGWAPSDVALDVSIAWGNSGGAVFDAEGRILGLADKVMLRPMGTAATTIGIGVMVPATRICPLLAR